MPLLARMVPAPLAVDVRAGALDDLPALLADQRISTSGRVAVAVGPQHGAGYAARLRPALRDADFFTVPAGTVAAAVDLAGRIGRASYDAVVGIGGGRVLDVTKYAAGRLGLPMVAAATNLAHDGVASPVAILDHDAGRGSYGVPAPIAVVVDLTLVRAAPPRSVRAGVGEAVSNLSAIADWELAHERRGEPVDGLAVSLARSAGQAVLHEPGALALDSTLRTLAEALVLSGTAMAVAGTSRPCSGACHEISHAIDRLFPDRAGYHGEQVGLGAAFATFLRGDTDLFADLVGCLARHGLPTRAAELGLADAELVEAVRHAPGTRPGRFTILEHLGLDAAGIARQVAAYTAAVDELTAAHPARPSASFGGIGRADPPPTRPAPTGAADAVHR